MYRYIAVLWDPRDLNSVRTSQALLALPAGLPSGWSVAHASAGSFVVHSGVRERATQAHALAGDRGVILGTLFRADSVDDASHRQIVFDEDQSRRIVASGLQLLVDRYWGSYVAFARNQSSNEHLVLREPTGNMPCYHARQGGVHIFFSHAEDCVRLLALRLAIDRRYLTRWLVSGRIQDRDCGLEGVEEILGGERLKLAGSTATRELLWNPVRFADRPRLEQVTEAACELRNTVQHAVNAWASRYSVIALRLSGGLDSSIVAACLAHAPSQPQITCLNFSIDVGYDQERLHLPGLDQWNADKIRAIAGHGDERHFARLVAGRWKFPLLERQRSLSMNLERMWQAPLMVSPPAFFAAMELDDTKIELARTQGVQAFFSGQAGDSVFLATVQPLPVIDYAYTRGPGRELLRHAFATAALSKESVWAALGQAFRYGVLRRPYRSPLRLLDQPTLLHPQVLSSMRETDLESLWARLASGLPPGKYNHMSGLAGSAYYDFVFHSGRTSDHIDPLNSQPVWELMLQIPTYTILAGGVSRGLARTAFGDLLPKEIRLRQMKGTGTPFYQQLVRRNRGFLRDHLLDSSLVREGYLDRRKLLEYFAAEDPFMMCNASQILAYLSAEIWIQQWTDQQQRTTESNLARPEPHVTAHHLGSDGSDSPLGEPSALAR